MLYWLMNIDFAGGTADSIGPGVRAGGSGSRRKRRWLRFLRRK